MSNNFNIYRRDRRSKNGGCVLISICSKYTSEIVELCSSEDFEFVCVMVHNRGRSVYITCSYIPPCSDINIYSVHFVLISKEGTIVVLGSLVPCSSVPFYGEILSIMCGLFQVNVVLNSMGRILDLVFLEDPSITSHRSYICS